MARCRQRPFLWGLVAVVAIGIAKEASATSVPVCAQPDVPVTNAKCKSSTCKTIDAKIRFCPINHRCDTSLKSETIDPRTGCKITVCLRGGLVTPEKQWPPSLACENNFWCTNGQCIGSNPPVTCAIPGDEVSSCTTAPQITTDCPQGKDCSVAEVAYGSHSVSGRPIYSCRTSNFKLHAKLKDQWIPVEYVDCHGANVWRLQSAEVVPAGEKLEITCVSACPQKPACSNWNTKCAAHATCVDASTGPECRCDTNFIDTSKDHNKPHGSVCQPCKRVALDVAIVLDTSKSVGEENIQKMKSYVQDFMGLFKVGTDDVRFAVSQYPTEKDTKLKAYSRIEFSDFTNIKDLQEAVRMRVNNSEAFTCTSHAMEFSHQQYFGRSYQGDRMRQKVMIVVTDGNPFCPDNYIKESDSDERIKIISKKLRDDGVAIFAVGVGEVDKETLTYITGQSTHSIYVDDFTKLALHQSVSDLQKIICVSPPPPPPTVKCSDSCHSSAKCIETTQGEYQCRCLDGFRDASSEHHKNPGTICEKCEKKGLDIAFVLDTSGSVSQSGTDKMKEWMIEFMSQFKIGSGDSDTRFAVSTYPKEQEKNAKFVIEFNDFGDLGRLQQGVRDRVTWTNAWTCQSHWQEESYYHFFEKNYDGDSRNRTKVMIHVTDGSPNCPSTYLPEGDTEGRIERVSMFARSKGVALFGVGVGSVTQQILDVISGNSENTIHVRDMNMLNVRTTMDKLQKLVCKADVVGPVKPQPPPRGHFSNKCSDICKPLLNTTLTCPIGRRPASGEFPPVHACANDEFRDSQHFRTGCRITSCKAGHVQIAQNGATTQEAWLYCNDQGLWCDPWTRFCYNSDTPVTCSKNPPGCSKCTRPRRAGRHCKPGLKCFDDELFETVNSMNGCKMWKCNPGYSMIVLTGSFGWLTDASYAECHMDFMFRLNSLDTNHHWEVSCVPTGTATCTSKDAPKCDANAKCVDAAYGAECRCNAGFVDATTYGQLEGSLCQQCEINSLDVLFVLDTSGSIGDGNTDKMKSFIKNLMYLFKMDGSEEAIRFAFAQSGEPKGKSALFRIGFTDYGDYESLGNGISKKITATKGARCTSSDIEQSFERYFGDENYITIGKRQKVVVVFTEGEPDCPNADSVDRIESTCNKLRTDGVAVYAVGIGNNIKRSTLQKIAGGDEKVFYVNHFDNLLLQRSVSDLQQLICKTVPTPTRETCKTTKCPDNSECQETTNGPICRCVQGYVDVSAERNLTSGSVCKVCTKNTIDVAFVLDTSGSVQAENVDRMKTFVADFVSGFKMGFGQNRFGVAQSNSIKQNSALFRIELNSFINKQHWIEALNQRVTWSKGMTCTSYDMEQSYQHFYEKDRLKEPNRKRVMVLITDGEPSCDVYDDTVERLEKVATDIRANGVTLIVIGIGKEINRKTIERIGGRNAFYLDDFTKLQVRDYFDKVHNKVCEASRITTCSQLQCEANTTTCVDTPQGGECRCKDGLADYSDAGQKPGSVCKECLRTGLDIAFMLDTSRSVGEENTQKMKNFVTDFIRRFRVNFGGTRFALAQSPATGDKVAAFRFKLNDGHLHDLYAKMISDRVKYTGGGTCTSYDIQQTHKEFFVDKYPEVTNQKRQKVLIVITDGDPDCAYPGKDNITRIESVCNDIRSKGVQIFAIGIGQVKKETLDKIAGNTAAIYYENYNALDVSASVAKLQTSVCTPPGGGGSAQTCNDLQCQDNAVCEQQPYGPVCGCKADYRELNGSCEKCAKKGLDFVFVLDTSSSVGDYNTQRMKRFVNDFIATFRVGFGGTRFALAQSPKDGDKQAYMHIKLNDFADLKQLQTAINDKVYFSAGHTCTSYDIEQAYQEYYVRTYPKVQTGDRRMSMIVITDGEPSCNYSGGDDVARYKTVCDGLRSKGIDIFAIGVGDVKKSTLEVIAGADKAFYYDSFEDLDLRKNVLGLQKAVCDSS